MSSPTYVLVPGAGSDSWYWHRIVPLLRERGREAVAVDLPVDDDSADLHTYVDLVRAALGTSPRVVLVAQSMGALSASVVAGRPEVERLVLVAPMIPFPGETGGEWWANTGQEEAARRLAITEGRDPDAAFDPFATFLHDVPADVAEESGRHVRDQSGRPFATPWPLEEWPDVETRVVAARHDRLFPLEFMQRISRERLGLEPDVIDSGHLPALSRPRRLTELLLSYE